MKDESRKLLTEKLLGECWHELIENAAFMWNKDAPMAICSCGKTTYCTEENRTFTTPDDMMAVKDKLVEKGEWESFDRFAYGEFCRRADKFQIEITGYVSAAYSNWLINPTRFCELAAGFLKDSKD
jgi:hypothetical protein